MRKSSSGFTILELLVAMAVMAMMLVLLLQITNHTMQVSKTATQQLDSTQSARQILDALSSDIAHAVLTDGSTILTQAAGGAPTLAFLTSGRGPDITPSRFLAVSYKLENNMVSRAYKAIGWADIPTTYSCTLYAAEAALYSPDSTSTLSTGILQFSVLAILEDGTMVSLLAPPANAAGVSGTVPFEGQTVPAGWTALVPARPPVPVLLIPSTARARALFVAIASIDEQNLSLLGPSAITFTQATTSDPVAAWETELAAKSLPGPARAAIRFNSKVIPFP